MSDLPANLDAKHPHLLADLWLDDVEVLKYVEPLRGYVAAAAARGNASVYHEYWHQFEPFGVTGFLLLKESHISVHTWVEEAFLALDIFACGPMSVEEVLNSMKEALRPSHVRTLYVDRAVASTRGRQPPRAD